MKLDLAFKKVLIFGIDSFTGKHLSVYLSNEGFEVFGTSLVGSQDGITFECDITDIDNIREIVQKVRPNYIINLAAISFVGSENKKLFYTINVLGVENILLSLTELDYLPKKVILVSSATIYGNQEETILDEMMTPNPINHYGVSKLAMEQIAKTYFDKLNIIITRPFNYTGVGQEEHFLIPKIVSHFKSNKKIIELGNIEVFREFNDILYVCEIYKRLLEVDSKNEIVNICSNHVIALKDVIEKMNDISGYKIDIIINPEFVRKNEIVSLSGSTQRLYDLIGAVSQKEFKQTLLDMFNQ